MGMQLLLPETIDERLEGTLDAGLCGAFSFKLSSDCSSGFGHRRPVRVAPCATTIEDVQRSLCERSINLESVYQIGIGDEGLAEGHQICPTLLDRVDGKPSRIAIVGDVCAAKRLAERLEIEGIYVVGSACLAFDAVQIGEAERAQAFGQKAIGGLRVAIERGAGA